MISKLIVWGADRTEAIDRMIRALMEYHINGVKTTIPFCLAVMENEKFRSGDFDTHFVEQEFIGDYLEETGKPLEPIIAAGALLYHLRISQQGKIAESPISTIKTNSWKARGRRENQERLAT